ncbi:hypothetical protein EDD99_7203 [Streptomyces sp. 846.5]|nr:hypothetical protein [Streptomyces sp. 846.5]TDT95375.1 hypothetical protein EDD99_7203 [Streptomyces sp. 846.5]
MSLRGTVSAVALVAAVGTAIAGCGSSASKPQHTPYVELSSGSYQGSAWQLFAWQQDAQLCMALLPGGADPDHPSPSSGGSWAGAGGAGCAFNNHDSGTGYYAGSTGPAGSRFAYGPLPETATQIRVAANEILTTAQLPGGKGLPAGRYWIHLMAKDWPSATDGAALDTPQPLDARGGKVAFQDF